MTSEQPSYVNNSDDTNTFVSDLINHIVSNIPNKTLENFNTNKTKINYFITDKHRISYDKNIGGITYDGLLFWVD